MGSKPFEIVLVACVCRHAKKKKKVEKGMKKKNERQKKSLALQKWSFRKLRKKKKGKTQEREMEIAKRWIHSTWNTNDYVNSIWLASFVLFFFLLFDFFVVSSSAAVSYQNNLFFVVTVMVVFVVCCRYECFCEGKPDYYFFPFNSQWKKKKRAPLSAYGSTKDIGFFFFFF